MDKMGQIHIGEQQGGGEGRRGGGGGGWGGGGWSLHHGGYFKTGWCGMCMRGLYRGCILHKS